jgi:hypothetical protein
LKIPEVQLRTSQKDSTTLSSECKSGRVSLHRRHYKVEDLPDGTKAWMALASGVFLYDIWALSNDKETMSAAFERAMHHPSKRWIVTLCWAATTKHLFLRRVAERVDPFVCLVLVARAIKLLKEKKDGLAYA